MAEFSIETNVKRPRLDCLDNLDNNSCDFCGKPFTKKNPAVNPDVNKLHSLFKACKDRWDERGIRLLSLENRIVNKEIIIKYHRNCKATYCSSYHINNYKKSLNKKH